MTKVNEPIEIHKNVSLEDLPGEIWMDIIGYEGFYQISSLSRVLSLERVVKSCWGSERLQAARIIRAGMGTNHYLTVSLNKMSKAKTHKIHRLVALHFIPNPENKKEVNHKNLIKTDNRIENLEWTTPKENSMHSVKMGARVYLSPAKKFGYENPHSIEVIEYNAFGEVIARYGGIREAARRIGVTKASIREWCNGAKRRDSENSYTFGTTNRKQPIKMMKR